MFTSYTAARSTNKLLDQHQIGEQKKNVASRREEGNRSHGGKERGASLGRRGPSRRVALPEFPDQSHAGGFAARIEFYEDSIVHGEGAGVYFLQAGACRRRTSEDVLLVALDSLNLGSHSIPEAEDLRRTAVCVLL